MLRFFRVIRERLVSEGKVRAYLLYAIGEIFLVVIGILIALQVNNWNIQRQNKTAEEQYLERLVIELENDLESITISIQSNLSRKERGEFLIKTKTNPDLVEENPTYFIQSIEYTGYTNAPVISNHTFEEIKSSGKLSILRNEEIRTELAKYYTNIQYRGQYDFIAQDVQLKYLEAKTGILSEKRQMEMGNFNFDVTYAVAEAKEAYHRMLNKPEFLEVLPITIQSKNMADRNLKSRHESALALYNLIKIELEK
jgi:hypothetical protein